MLLLSTNYVQTTVHAVRTQKEHGLEHIHHRKTETS